MTSSIGDSPEFNPDWDVYRNAKGEPVTITEEQVHAIFRAINVVQRVRNAEGHPSLWENPMPNLHKSRLLGRMLLYGKPPTRRKPPTEWAGPAWNLLSGGDPFGDSPARPDHPE